MCGGEREVVEKERRSWATSGSGVWPAPGNQLQKKVKRTLDLPEALEAEASPPSHSTVARVPSAAAGVTFFLLASASAVNVPSRGPKRYVYAYDSGVLAERCLLPIKVDSIANK